MSKTDHCSLYWICEPSHDDVFTQGYVGISYDPEYRLKQHIALSKGNRISRHPEFTKALVSGSYNHQILLIASREYCMSVERILRPSIGLGWNIAIGGDGGNIFKHGLTSSKYKRDFFNMLSRARDRGLIVCDDWLGEDALENFKLFYDLKGEAGKQLVLPQTGLLSADTVVFKSRIELMRSVNKSVLFRGEYHSVAGLSELYNVKANTISTRIKRGWSIEDAIFGRDNVKSLPTVD